MLRGGQGYEKKNAKEDEVNFRRHKCTS
jgi:hypothetical protein